MALIVLGAQTRGGVMDSAGDVRHLIVMAICLVPLAWIVAVRAYDAGASDWLSVLAIPSAAAGIALANLLSLVLR